MPDETDQGMQILLTRIIDVLGVIVGGRCLHLPTDGPPLSSYRRDGDPCQRFCGKTSGGVFARYAFAQMPMCRDGLHIAAHRVRADDWSEYRAAWPPARPRSPPPRF